MLLGNFAGKELNLIGKFFCIIVYINYYNLKSTSPWKEENIMSQFYYVNNNQTRNPGLHHEVHTATHANELKITDKTFIGFFDNENDAVAKAKQIYTDADGCAICCPKAHRG